VKPKFTLYRRVGMIEFLHRGSLLIDSSLYCSAIFQ